MFLQRYDGEGCEGFLADSESGRCRRLPTDMCFGGVGRLAIAVECASCLLGVEPHKLPVAVVYDEKGCLKVYWTTKPTLAQERAFGVAWEHCGEPADNNEHFWHPDQLDCVDADIEAEYVKRYRKANGSV